MHRVRESTKVGALSITLSSSSLAPTPQQVTQGCPEPFPTLAIAEEIDDII